MAADFNNKLIVNNLLCFMRNKIGKLACRPLKSLVTDFYNIDDISNAKEALLVEIDILKFADFPRIHRNRRGTAEAGKPALDIDDIYTVFIFLDEHGHTKDLPTFVSDNPDKMPSINLSNGDLDFMYDKIKKLDDKICDIDDKFSCNSIEIKEVKSCIASLQTSIDRQYKSLLLA